MTWLTLREVMQCKDIFKDYFFLSNHNQYDILD